MLYKFVGRNMNVSDKLKNVAEKKLNRLDKFFATETTVNVTFKEEGRGYRVEVTIPVKGTNIRAEVPCVDPYTGIDEVLDRLERRITRHREKLYDRAKQDSALRGDYFNVPETTENPDPIVRIKTVETLVMTRKEACLQLELTGHDFYVFRDSETEKDCVVYRRLEPGTYGLLIIE